MRIISLVLAGIACGLLMPKGMYIEAGAASLLSAVFINILYDILDELRKANDP